MITFAGSGTADINAIGALTITGSGSLTIGTNTYAGATNISAGNLFMTGTNQATTSSISVNANCALGLKVTP